MSLIHPPPSFKENGAASGPTTTGCDLTVTLITPWLNTHMNVWAGHDEINAVQVGRQMAEGVLHDLSNGTIGKSVAITL